MVQSFQAGSDVHQPCGSEVHKPTTICHETGATAEQLHVDFTGPTDGDSGTQRG